MNELLPVIIERGLLIIGGLISGGALVAYIRGKYDLKLKEMDHSAEERKQLREELNKLEKRFEDSMTKYYDLMERYSGLQAKYEGQEQEIKRLQRQLKDMEVYKSQTKLIALLRADLNEYFKDNDSDKLIDNITKRLIG